MREAHNQYKHSIKLLQNTFWTVSRISSVEIAEGEANMSEGRKVNKCKRYNLPHILNGVVQCSVFYKSTASFLYQSHNIMLLS